MFKALNLKLESVEIKAVPAVHSPYRREIVHTFAENEFDELTQKITDNTLTDDELQNFCDRFSGLALVPNPIPPMGEFEQPKMVVLLHFKESRSKRISRHYTLMGFLDEFYTASEIPDTAIFTPTGSWGSTIIDEVTPIPLPHVEIYETSRGFEPPFTCVKPAKMLEQQVIAQMAAGNYYSDDIFITQCYTTNTQISLSDYLSPSAYLWHLIKGIQFARTSAIKNANDQMHSDDGIRDCVQYLLRGELDCYSNPLVHLFARELIIPPTMKDLRGWLPDMDKLTTITFPKHKNYLGQATQLGVSTIEEVIAQQLVLDAIALIAKSGLRELHIQSTGIGDTWSAIKSISKTPHAKNNAQIAQKVSDRLRQQFFTKYAELLCGIYPIIDLKLDITGISEINICYQGALGQIRHAYAFPTYNIPAWSPMLMEPQRASGFSRIVYEHANMLINV